MEEEQFEKTPRKATRWFRAFVILSLIYGITFSLHTFFNWIFFFAAAYSFFMSYYLLPVQPKIFQARQPRGSQFGSGRATMNVPPGSGAARATRIVQIVVAGIVGLFAFLFVIGMIFGDDEEVQTSQPEEQQTYDASDESAVSLVSRGNDFFNDQSYDSADKYYDLALASDPGNMEAVYGKGIVLYQKGNKDEANGYFTRAYEGGFRYAWLSWALADMYDSRGATSRAIDLYKESVNLDSTFTDSYTRLAELLPDERDKYLRLLEKHKQ